MKTTSTSHRLIVALCISIALHTSVLASNVIRLKDGSNAMRSSIHAKLLAKHSTQAPKSTGEHIDDTVPQEAENPPSTVPTYDKQEVLSIPLTTYFGPKELTRRPSPLTDPNLESPLLNSVRTPGKVRFLLFIDHQGSVTAIYNGDSNLPDDYREEVKKRLQNTHFQPGQIEGHDVNSRMTIEINFAPTPQANPPH